MTEEFVADRHTVIMGCGPVGASVTTSLTSHGHIVHILDSSTEKFNRLPTGELESHRVVPILGNGVIQKDLIKAQIENAAVFIALTNEDSRNAMAAQIAKRVFSVPIVICRIEDPIKQDMYLSLDVTAFSASNLLTDMILDAASSTGTLGTNII